MFHTVHVYCEACEKRGRSLVSTPGKSYEMISPRSLSKSIFCLSRPPGVQIVEGGAGEKKSKKKKKMRGDYPCLYGLSQLITEPTRVTPDSKTLIDLCITNSPEKITNSGVIHLGISDHSLVFLSRKTQYCRTGPRVIETRQFQHFNRGKFLRATFCKYHG